MDKLRIYTDISVVAEGNLKNLTPPLSFHWRNLDRNAISAGESDPDSPFCVTTDPSEADWFMLPMIWSYYLWDGKANMGEAVHLAKLAGKYQKKVIVWHKGDLVPVIPFDNAIVFLPGMVKSKAKSNQRACPVFIDDPVPIYLRGRPLYGEKKDKPTVGFCGYARDSSAKALWGTALGLRSYVSSRVGRFDFVDMPILPTTTLRAHALRLLEAHPAVDTRFIIRDKYTERRRSNGPNGTGDISQVFFSNIHETDYTLCLRGNGNWSYRFYETLACGRIPVFIDTDCVLPAESQIDWKKYCVWVDRSEIGLIGEKISDFHSSLSEEDFLVLQRDCRALWEGMLSQKGFLHLIPGFLNA